MAVFVIKPKQRGDDASSLYFFQCSLLFKIRKFYKKVEISDEIRICSRKHEIRTNFIHERKTAIIKTCEADNNIYGIMANTPPPAASRQGDNTGLEPLPALGLITIE